MASTSSSVGLFLGLGFLLKVQWAFFLAHPEGFRILDKGFGVWIAVRG